VKDLLLRVEMVGAAGLEPVTLSFEG
jgi:hypothetical protein